MSRSRLANASISETSDATFCIPTIVGLARRMTRREDVRSSSSCVAEAALAGAALPDTCQGIITQASQGGSGAPASELTATEAWSMLSELPCRCCCRIAQPTGMRFDTRHLQLAPFSAHVARRLFLALRLCPGWCPRSF